MCAGDFYYSTLFLPLENDPAALRLINPEVPTRLNEHSVRFCGLKGRSAEAPWLCSNRVY